MNEQPLIGQRVLLIAPRFFGYEYEMKAELERQGAQVDLLPDRPFDSAWLTAAARFRPVLVLPHAERIHRRLLESFGASCYDTILVVNGQTLTPDLRHDLRNQFPRARWVLYMWDSLRNRPATIDALSTYDEAFTFDPDDSKSFNMKLRPLFYGPRFARAPQAHHDYEVSFVGTAHTDRFSVIKAIRDQLPSDTRALWYLYLQAPWVYYAYRWTNPCFKQASRSDFSFTPLTKDRVGEIFESSLAIVDIEHPQQRGLTMRTFEAIGAHKKLISTNAQVKDYDFFDPANICVIDRANPQIPAGFLQSPVKPLAPSTYQRLSIAGWVREVLGIGDVVVESGTTSAIAPGSAAGSVPLATHT